ncbi:MAG: SBBP repeat-containing protein [Bryobacteraceae bacterium]
MAKASILVRPSSVARSAWVISLVLLSAVAIPLVIVGSPQTAAQGARPASGRLPLSFVANRGQLSQAVRFMTRTAGANVYFTPGGVLLGLPGTSLHVSFIDPNPSAMVEGVDPLPGKAHFLLGNDPGQWKTDVPTFNGVIYRDVFPCVDASYSGHGGILKSEFRLRAGADPARIVWRYEGAQGLRLDTNGDLVISTAAGDLREKRPEAYQISHGRRVSVAIGFRLIDAVTAGFAAGEYDHELSLTIDPILAYSTYLDGSGLDSAKAIAIDSAGCVYITGQTDSSDFPLANALKTTNAGSVDVFVTKLNATGTALVYSTYIGGSSDDRGLGIAVDGSGTAYLTGWTASSNFPVTTGVRQKSLGGGRDAFVARLNATGSAFVFSEFLGGISNDSGNGIVIDSSGYAYIVGDTYSTNFPVTSGYRTANAGQQDVFISKLKGDGTAFVWSTYLGGSGNDTGKAIAIDGSRNVYVTGGTDSADLPVINAIQSSNGGAQDAFVAKLNADGKTLTYATYLGGSGGTLGANEFGTGIRADSAGNAYVTGITSSTNFPTANAYQSLFAGGTWDGFVAKISPSGSSLAYCTYLGGVGIDYPMGLALESGGAVAVVGYTSSTDFPVVDALQSTLGGGYDAFVARFSPQGTGLTDSTYLGGNDNDIANSVAVDAAGALYVGGQTLSADFPLKNPIQSAITGGYSVFVAKIAGVTPTASYRAASGATVVNVFGSTTRYSAGGVITSDPAVSQNSTGDTYVAGRNNINDVWMNVFQFSTRTWRGWLKAGGPAAGTPALVAATGGEAFLVTRNASSNYVLNHYTPSGGFQGWVNLGGSFVSDPAADMALDGTVYIAGTASSGAVHSGRYVPGSGFQGWISGAGAAAGKPALVVGADGAAYLSVKGTDNAIWMARIAGDLWGPWIKGGGTLGSDPELAATGGTIYAVVTGPTGVVYVKPFLEGTADGWQSWISTSGTLNRASIAAAGNRYYVTGRTSTNDFWWYQSGTGWIFYGNLGSSVGDVFAAPK